MIKNLSDMTDDTTSWKTHNIKWETMYCVYRATELDKDREKTRELNGRANILQSQNMIMSQISFRK
jgi:hypothetical protein